MHPLRMNPEEARKALENGALLVDVRAYEQIEGYDFVEENKIALPITEFGARYTELPDDRLVIMACSVGVNSLKTAYYLLNMGYTKVANLEGGIEAWEAAGYPVHKNADRPVSSGCCCGIGSEAEETDCCDETQAVEDNLSSGSCCC
ncbi:MAG: rhodanese-like domain-containing protein [Calditrichaeota bacterium]|nr:MAG: rhodanese-like domain-containing protein [Calditrichota bacterium]